MKYYYFVYQTINCINGNIYVGVHKTSNLDDRYLGSGKILKLAIQKYGRENFNREILSFHDNLEEAHLREREIVNEEFIERDDTYNLNLGGHGSWAHRNKIPMSLETKEKISKAQRGKIVSEETKSKLRKPCTDERRANISSSLKGRIFNQEHKKKISENHADVSGENNPMFGKGPTKGSFKKDNHPFAKKITIDGITYSSILQASRALGRSRGYVAKLANLQRDDQDTLE